MSYRHHGTYGSLQGRSDRGRPTPEKAQLWVLTKPANVAELSSTLGIPGFFRLKGTEREDKLTEEQIKNGYKEPYFAGLEREYWSMRQQMSPHAHAIKAAAVENIEQLFYLKEMRAKQAKAREKFLNYKIRQQVPLFPPLNASMVQQKDAFVRDLSDPTLRLYTLAPRAPHGYNPQTLLEALVEHKVPVPRAVWFVKVFLLNKFCKPDGSLIDRSKPSLSITWTTFLMKSIKEKAVEVFLPSLSRNKGDDEGQENCKRRNHLLYLKNLLSFSIAEELIDYATLCACLVDAVSNKATEIDAFFLALCAEHAVQLVRNPSAWHKLLAVCTNFICNAHVHVGEERRSALRASFAQFLSLSVQVSPDIVAALEDDAFADISSLLEPIALWDITRLRARIRLKNSETRDPVAELDRAMCQTSVWTLDVLWLSLFSNKSEIWTNKGIGEAAQKVIFVICEWAVRDKSTASSERFLLAASLISQTHHRIIYETTRFPRGSGMEITYPLEHALLDFIDAIEPTSESGAFSLSQWEALVRLLASLLRAKVVSYVRYLRTLSTRGILNPSPNDSQTPHIHAAKHVRILSALPIFGKQEKIRDQRVVTLTPLNENISKEHEYIETGLERLQSTLTGANNVSITNENLFSLCSYLSGAPSIYARSMLAEWLLNFAVSGINALSTSSYSLRRLLSPVIALLEVLREVETLSSLLLYVLHHSQAMDTVVLNALSNYQFVYFTQRRILSVLVALHSKLSSVSSLSASEPLKARIAFLVALWLLRYAHLPEVKEWKEKVAILDMAVQTHLDRLKISQPETFQLVTSASQTTANTINVVLAPYLDPKASPLLPLSIHDDVTVVSSLKIAHDDLSSVSAVLASLVTSLAQLPALSQEELNSSDLIGDSSDPLANSSLLAQNALHVIRGLSYSLPLFHESSLLPLNVLRSLIRTEIRNQSFSRARARAMGMLVLMLLWERSISLNALIVRALADEYSAKDFAQPLALLFRALFVEAPALLAPLRIIPQFLLRMDMDRLEGAAASALIGALSNLRKVVFPLDLPLASTWVGNMLLRDSELLFSALRKIGEPRDARALFHEHLCPLSVHEGSDAMEIEEYTMTHVQKVEHIVSKDDAEKAGKGELDSTLFALSQWNVESSWLSLRLLLDEWTAALGDTLDPHCAVPAFTSSFMRLIIDSIDQFAYIKSQPIAEESKRARSMMLTDVQLAPQTKRLCVLMSRLMCSRGILFFIKSIVEAEEWTNNSPVSLRGLGGNTLGLSSPSTDRGDTALEAAFVLLLHTASNGARKDFSLEQALSTQLEKLKTEIGALPSSSFAGSVPCWLVNHANLFIRLTVPLIEILVTSTGAQYVRESLACAVLRLLCSERYVERAASTDWSVALHVFGALVAPESERFSSSFNTNQEKIHFRRTLIETLSTCTLPFAYRERIEQVAPAFQPKASARPTSRLPEGVDPWTALDDHPEPLLMNKIIKDAPQEREELALGRVLTSSNSLIGKRKEPPEGAEESASKRSRMDASTPNSAKTPTQPMFPASPTTPPNELEINSPSPIPPRPSGPPAKEVQFDTSLSQLTQPDYQPSTQSQTLTAYDYAPQVQYSSYSSANLPPRPPPSAQRRADLSRLTRPPAHTHAFNASVPPRPSPIKRFTEPPLRHTTNPLRRSRGKH